MLRCLRGFVSRDSPFFYSPLAFRVGQHLASNSRLRPFDEMAATERESDAAKMMLRVLLPTGRQTVVAVPSDYTGQVSHNTAALCFGFKKGEEEDEDEELVAPMALPGIVDLASCSSSLPRFPRYLLPGRS